MDGSVALLTKYPTQINNLHIEVIYMGKILHGKYIGGVGIIGLNLRSGV